MRTLFLLLFTSVCLSTAAQNVNCPPNFDFEEGTFNHWDCFLGTTTASGGNNSINLSPSVATAGRHEIFTTGSGNDTYGNFPKVCPYGGAYSVKLGNDNTGAQAEGLSYTFQIPPSADTFSLTYYYAVVFEDPGHSIEEQPRFFVSAYDVLTGAVIHCASYSYVSNGSIPGFQVSANNFGVLYKDWTPSSIDFSGLAGRQVRLEFKTADCTLGGHFGYAYLDVGTGCGGVLAAGAYCTETNSVTLSAPYGFQTYSWYNNNYSTLIGNARTITLSPPPPVNSVFHVDMIPYPGYGCRDTADAALTVLPVPDTPVAVSNIYYCVGSPPALLAATAAAQHELIWYTVPAGGTPFYSPPMPSTAAAGIFNWYVSQKTFYGCESARKKISVHVAAIPSVSFSVNAMKQCETGNNFIVGSTSTNVNGGSTYLWNFGDGTTATGVSAAHSYSGLGMHTITLEVSNTQACVRQTNKTVEVIGKPTALFTYPPVICESQTMIALQDNSSMPGGTSTVTGWQWQVGTATYSVQNPPPFMMAGGILPVKLVVTNNEGCISAPYSASLPVYYAPSPAFSYGPKLCNNEVIKFRDLSAMPAAANGDVITAWQWSYDNTPSSTLQHPSNLFTTGAHHVELIAKSSKGCNFRIADSTFIISPKPSVALSITDSCVNRNIIYTASGSPAPAVSKWFWNIGNGLHGGGMVESKYYGNEGSFTVMLIGETGAQCRDTLIRPFTIYKNRSVAVRDTIAAIDETVQLAAGDTANVSTYTWTPLTGLSAANVSNPFSLYNKDISYHLFSLTKQGCESNSNVLIKRYNGPELYVPSAFTPNNDGRNDLLHVIAVGIKEFRYLEIYNRRGQRVFSTENFHTGWDGTFKGAALEAGNYVWMAMGIDYRGKTIFKKGNILLLR